MPIDSDTQTTIDVNGNTVLTTQLYDGMGNPAGLDTRYISPTGESLGGLITNPTTNSITSFDSTGTVTTTPMSAGTQTQTTAANSNATASITNNQPFDMSTATSDAASTAGARFLFQNSGDNNNGYIIFYYKAAPYVVLFQGLPDNISEGREASYQDINIAKRMEPLLIYQFSSFRHVSFDLTFGVNNNKDAKDLYTLMSLIRRSVMPTQRGVPMFCKINLGGWILNMCPTELGFERDDYTNDLLNCMVAGYTITPSKERLYDPATFGNIQNASAINWSAEKIPAKVSIRLDLKVFQQVVWSGVNIVGPGANVEKDETSTTLPPLNSTTSTAAASSIPRPGDANFVDPTQPIAEQCDTTTPGTETPAQVQARLFAESQSGFQNHPTTPTAPTVNTQSVSTITPNAGGAGSIGSNDIRSTADDGEAEAIALLNATNTFGV
jgi:hypothetical protein